MKRESQWTKYRNGTDAERAEILIGAKERGEWYFWTFWGADRRAEDRREEIN